MLLGHPDAERSAGHQTCPSRPLPPVLTPRAGPPSDHHQAPSTTDSFRSLPNPSGPTYETVHKEVRRRLSRHAGEPGRSAGSLQAASESFRFSRRPDTSGYRSWTDVVPRTEVAVRSSRTRPIRCNAPLRALLLVGVLWAVVHWTGGRDQ